MCTSKATPVSRSRGWCSMRTIVSRKVTLIRRRTVNTDRMRDIKSFISTDLSDWVLHYYCVRLWCLSVATVTCLHKDDRCSLIHLSQWFVQTSQAPPEGQVAPQTPPGGPSGTPEPAACWRSCLMTSLESPNPHLSVTRSNGDQRFIYIRATVKIIYDWR